MEQTCVVVAVGAQDVLVLLMIGSLICKGHQKEMISIKADVLNFHAISYVKIL